MRITSSGEVLVIGEELLVDVEAVDVGLSMVGESMAIPLSCSRAFRQPVRRKCRESFVLSGCGSMRQPYIECYCTL